jgi:hypothetical protein
VHAVNLFDLVPMLAGVGTAGLNPFVDAGADAAIKRFHRFNAPTGGSAPNESLTTRLARTVDQTVHGPRDVYWKMRAGV